MAALSNLNPAEIERQAGAKMEHYQNEARGQIIEARKPPLVHCQIISFPDRLAA